MLSSIEKSCHRKFSRATLLCIPAALPGQSVGLRNKIEPIPALNAFFMSPPGESLRPIPPIPCTIMLLKHVEPQDHAKSGFVTLIRSFGGRLAF